MSPDVTSAPGRVDADALDDAATWALDVARILARMRPEARGALHLVYGDRLTHRQAARSHDISERDFAAQFAVAFREFTAAVC